MSAKQSASAAAAKGATLVKKGGIVRKGLETTDTIARELDIPLVATVLAVQDKIFGYADSLGIGEEVRSVTYALRAGTMVGAVLGPAASSAAAGAAAGALGSMGALGAIGAVAVAAAVLGAIFGGGPSDEEIRRKKQANERHRARLVQMLKRLSFEDLAREQDEIVKANTMVADQIDSMSRAKIHVPKALWDVQAKAQKASNRAKKVAAFYRGLPPKLTELEEEFFLSMTNLGRWTVSRKRISELKGPDQERCAAMVFDKLGLSQADQISVLTQGKGGSKKFKEFPKVTALLTKQIEAETIQFNKASALLPAGYKPPGAPKDGPRIALTLPQGFVPAAAKTRKASGAMKVAVPAAAAAAGFFVFGPIGAAVALAAGIGLSRS
jgi:hypothetical protein